VLFGISLEVRTNEIVALIGPNGAGKSTVLKAVCGLIPVWSGKIRLNGTVTNGLTPRQNVGLGLMFAPQGSRVFTDLTVVENLEIGGWQLARRALGARITQMLDTFPALKERAHQVAGKLSGGERQMLSLARALIPSPRLLVLDEPSLGLSPQLTCMVFKRISEINADMGVTILIVEQKVRQVLDVAHRVYSLKLGKVAFEGTPGELTADTMRFRQLFL
jgi:branched-chain amino acid transport system ATP-binding protein